MVSHENLCSVIKDNWKINGHFSENSQHLTAILKEWNVNVFGYIFKQKKILLARIAGV